MQAASMQTTTKTASRDAVARGSGHALATARWRSMRIGLAVTLAISCVAQASEQPAAMRKFVPAGWTVEQELQGDLNDDGVADAVLMLMEAGHAAPTDEAGRLLVVLAGRADGSFEQLGIGKKVLLCVQCFGAMGGKPQLSIQRKALIVEQLTGSRETASGSWRFRFDSRSGRMRLIGLDVKKTDRATGVSTSESTNLLTGKRITESLRHDEATGKDVVVGRKTSSADTTPLFLEDVDAGPLDE
jgi:hypothetical protein